MQELLVAPRGAPGAGALFAFLLNRSRLFKIGALVTLDAALLAVAVVIAYMLRMSTLVAPPREIWLLLALGPLLTIGAAGLLGVYLSIARLRIERSDAAIILAQLPVILLWSACVLLIGRDGFPRSVIGIFAVMAPTFMIFARRVIAEMLRDQARALAQRGAVPTIIVGADARGAALYDSLQRRRDHRLVAFAETDPGLIGGTLAGAPIISIDMLPDLIEAEGVTDVIIAKGGFSRADHRRLVDMLRPFPATIKVVPSLEELVAGRIVTTAARPIAVSDVLGRDPVLPRGALLKKAVTGKTVLVLGAGGSIGSEIVRQVERYSPKSIILLDSCEFALFEIHREIEMRLHASRSQTKLNAVLGSICDKDLMLDVMTQNSVDVVFHAAAYKHVRMVQENIIAGVKNNIVGTHVAARAAQRAGVATFVLISTDKAVRPTSVMGATKRFAEMILQGLSRERSTTKFLSVRFGNVLGSSGSVVPLFQKQIEQGGPVTVTDPDVTRYFMLIPEAAQLVIQAAAMAKGGEVFVLDMGEPVRIVDLARKMIELTGASVRDHNNPDGDIEIKFVGMREGEKLHEELLLDGPVFPTAHHSIMQCHEARVTSEVITREMRKLEEIIAVGDTDRLKHEVMSFAIRGAAPIPLQHPHRAHARSQHEPKLMPMQALAK